MNITSERKYDIVVFGASGHTGTYVVEYMAKHCQNFRLALAGRDKNKLKSVLEEFSPNKHMDIVVADIDEPQTINSMCRDAVVLIDLVGPFRFYGDQVVSECVKTSTHYVDVSGEPQFLETSQLKYFEDAVEKGIYIVGACGFDSVPCDYGIALIKENFVGDVNSVESFLHHKNDEEETVNYATWESAIHGFANADCLKPLRKQLLENVFKKVPPKSKFPLKKRFPLFRHEKAWCIPFPSCDRSVVSRSQFYDYAFKNERPVQANTYLCIPNFFKLLGTIFLGCVFMLLSKFTYGRHLLESYPEFFSGGLFSKTPPKREKQSADSSFFISFKVDGWCEKVESSQQHVNKPNKTAKAIFNFPNGGYTTTAICVVNCAIVILQERDKLPGNGGVFTPGAVFRKTSLLKRLEDNGVSFHMSTHPSQ